MDKQRLSKMFDREVSEEEAAEIRKKIKKASKFTPTGIASIEDAANQLSKFYKEYDDKTVANNQPDHSTPPLPDNPRQPSEK